MQGRSSASGRQGKTSESQGRSSGPTRRGEQRGRQALGRVRSTPSSGTHTHARGQEAGTDLPGSRMAEGRGRITPAWEPTLRHGKEGTGRLSSGRGQGGRRVPGSGQRRGQGVFRNVLLWLCMLWKFINP